MNANCSLFRVLVSPVLPFTIGLLVTASCATAAGQDENSRSETRNANSTAKIRIEPSTLASRAGSAVQWETSLTDAVQKSKASGKPIFWYVPTIAGTFMDRKSEINRYMLAGPFSWPAIINLLNEDFIPLQAKPTREDSEAFSLQPYQFVEPGFLVLREGNRVVLMADRLTTLHPDWFFRRLAAVVDEKRDWGTMSDGSAQNSPQTVWKRASELNWQLPKDDVMALAGSDNIQMQMLAGMLQFSAGQQAEARETWESIAKRHPEHPLAWKAACEAQGIGPFSRGFETFEPLPTSILSGEFESRLTSGSGPGRFSPEELWQRGSKYLLRMQDQSGGFFDSDYDFGGTDSLPNVHVAVSSIAGMALIQAKEKVSDPQLKEQLKAAIQRTVEFVSQDANLNFNDRDEILWAQAYRIRFLSAALDESLTPRSSREHLQRAVGQLESLQLNNGSWYHEYANSFVTATALSALHHAKNQSAEVNGDKIERALNRLDDQRMDNGAYPYATKSSRDGSTGTDQDLAASGGRVSVCELARRQWLRVEEPVLLKAVQTSFDHHDLLAKALKYDDHTSTYAYGGFFFWYGMHARSEAINLLANNEVKRDLATRQRDLILALPELDGCFVDSHELGRVYGTAMALISLALLEE